MPEVLICFEPSVKTRCSGLDVGLRGGPASSICGCSACIFILRFTWPSLVHEGLELGIWLRWAYPRRTPERPHAAGPACAGTGDGARQPGRGYRCIHGELTG